MARSERVLFLDQALLLAITKTPLLRMLAIAELAEREAFPILRMPDHLQNCRTVAGTPTMESFGILSAVAMRTIRPTLGQTVLCAAYRNPAQLVIMRRHSETENAE